MAKLPEMVTKMKGTGGLVERAGGLDNREMDC